MSAVGASTASAAPSGMSSAETCVSSMLDALHVVAVGGIAVLAGLLLAAVLLAFVFFLVGFAAAVLAHVERVEQIVHGIAERRWSSSTASSRSRSRPARSSISGRHRSTSLRAAGGGAMPVRRSRTIMASASSIGASARSVISSNLPRWKRSSSMAVRFSATPSMRRAPIASTRACSTASNTARACWPAGCRRRCTPGRGRRARSAIESAWPRTIAASALAELARRLRQPRLAAHQARAARRRRRLRAPACARSRAGSRRPRA